MKNLKFFLITIIICPNAFGHKWIKVANCVTTLTTPIEIKRVVSKKCNLIKDLTLTTKFMTYSELRDNPRNVQYWQGHYAKNVTTTTKELKDLINTCNGTIIRSKEFSYVNLSSINFNMINPNLDSQIKESYMLSPMSHNQAEQELARVLERCENYTE